MEFRELQSHMRRIGHIIEHAPNNIGQSLMGGRQAKAGAYVSAQAAFERTPGLTNCFFASSGYGDNANNQQCFANIQHANSNWDGYWGWYPDTGTAVDGETGAYAADSNMTDGGVPDHAESETDTDSSMSDTSSDSGKEVMDEPDLSGMNEEQKSFALFIAYRNARRNWRRHTRRPVRRFRRVVRKFKRRSYRRQAYNRPGQFQRGGRRHKRFGGRFYKSMDSYPSFDREWVNNYLATKKRRNNSSGKGFGRRENKFPVGKGGKEMGNCFRCGKPGHFALDER